MSRLAAMIALSIGLVVGIASWVGASGGDGGVMMQPSLSHPDGMW